jgi:DNA polymerase/3'-5' exonuclease PolX
MYSSNEKLSKAFDQLAIQFKEDHYRSRAYRNAASILKTHQGTILSGKEAMEIKGIGKSIAAKIDEFITTGKISIIEERKPEEVSKDSILQTFEKIHGVGPKTAEKWYNQGYRSLEDLAKIYNKMTDAQKMGYYYYHHLNTRIPREEMDQFANIIKDALTKIGATYMICGSYRRGEKDSGDIDCLIKGSPTTNLTLVLNALVKTGIMIGQLALGNTKYMGICRLNEKCNARRIDLMIIAEESWPYATLYFTGSKQLNVVMRSRALQLGYTMNEYRMESSNGNYLAKTEQDIFTALGMSYLEPHQRSLGHK